MPLKGLILTEAMRYFDLHCDSITASYQTGESVYDGKLQFNCVKSKDIKQIKQCFSLWLDDRPRGQAAFSYCNKLYERYLYETGNIHSKGVKNVTPILTMENCSSLAGNINNINYWKNMGVKMMGLTWNGDNELASGVKGNLKRGLTFFGRQCITEMERLDIIIDVSHLNEKGFRDLCRCAAKPFVASHSNCYDIYPHPRNLRKYQVDFIANTGGLIGLCFYKDFLCEDGRGVLECFYKNVYYLLDKGYEKNIAIGSDFDGAEASYDIKGIESIYEVYGYLSKRGIDEKILENIFYNNAEKFFSGLLFK